MVDSTLVYNKGQAKTGQTRSATLDLCVGLGSADVTTHAVLTTITNHSLLYRKVAMIYCLQIKSIHGISLCLAVMADSCELHRRVNFD